MIWGSCLKSLFKSVALRIEDNFELRISNGGFCILEPTDNSVFSAPVLIKLRVSRTFAQSETGQMVPCQTMRRSESPRCLILPSFPW
jgi:hypothetical protein